jgi:ATP-dependent exoDNAse (exonuclease V) beta subunit
VRAKGALRTYVIDRLFRDAEGVRWVVDFKTSRHEGGDLEAFLDEQRRRYQAQLDAYADVLAAKRKGIYLPLLSGWREW